MVGLRVAGLGVKSRDGGLRLGKQTPRSLRYHIVDQLHAGCSRLKPGSEAGAGAASSLLFSWVSPVWDVLEWLQKSFLQVL